MARIGNDIINKCKSGDKEAFRQIIQTYQQMIYSLALKMLCDEDEAKDIVQETFIRVWQNIQRYDTRKDIATWIYTIASRLCIDRSRNRKRIVSLSEDKTVFRQFTSNIDNQKTIENKEWIAIVKVLAEGLSEKQRLVFTLCQLEGLSSSEVEQITGWDAKQVKSNLYVARQTIRERLKQMGYE
ncbi:MAG: RNA polymerase sigma factor [Prevotella sp.]|nr:RNA polymerase sigma factor [Prevotella sp.]